MLSNSFYPAITKPTRITEYSATVIDNIFCNNLTDSLTGIIYEDVSDHLPIFIINSMKVKKLKLSCTMPSRNLCQRNLTKLNEILCNFDWSCITEQRDPETAYCNFVDKCMKMYDECCPTLHKDKKKLVKNIWMTPGLLKSRKTKEKLFKRFQMTPTRENKQR